MKRTDIGSISTIASADPDRSDLASPEAILFSFENIAARGLEFVQRIERFEAEPCRTGNFGMPG